MPKQLLTNFGREGESAFNKVGPVFVKLGVPRLGLDKIIPVDIEDTAHLSKYFQVVEFNPSFTAGKNSFSFNGSEFLANDSEIKMECIDRDGNSLYIDSPPKEVGYIDLANFTTAIHVNKEAVGGPGKVILVGTTTKGEIVRWVGNIYIDKVSTNYSRTRFYNAPTLEVGSFLYPIVSGSSDYGSSQAGTSHLVTITGSFAGYPYNRYQSYLPRAGGYYRIQASNFTLDPLLFPTASFNSQMVGQEINLTVTKIEDPSIFGRVINLNSPQTFKVSKIVNSNTIVLDNNIVNPSTGKVAWASEGTFSSTYVWIDDNVRSDYRSTASGSVLSDGYCEAVGHNPIVGQEVPSNFDYDSLDYRISIEPYSVKDFDSDMNGKTIVLHTQYSRIEPGGDIHIPLHVTTSFTIKRVLDNRTLQTTLPYTKYSGGKYPVVDITFAYYEVLDTQTGSIPPVVITSSLGNSYAEIVYRNLSTFSGYVKRHKLFINSLIYSPPQWELLADELIENSEMLTDPLASKVSQYIGGFYSQTQIDQHWIPNNTSSLNVLAYSNAADSMQIATVNDLSGSDGNQYVILKTIAPNIVNDATYYPFSELSHKYLSGSSYSSNLLHLRRNTLYVLSLDAKMQKSPFSKDAKVSFYFTSSTPEIIGEPSYTQHYGLKIGELSSATLEPVKNFENQLFFFTPKEDYHGTLVIVPYNANVVMTGLSLKIYGDYAFSPDTFVYRLPFSVHMANEGYQFKAELYDNNAVLVYSDLLASQTFDSSGGSGIIDTGGTPTYVVNDFTIGGNLILPGVANGPTNRILGINTATGIVAKTNVSDVSLIPTNNLGTVTSKDYVHIGTVEGSNTYFGRSILLRYSGSTPNVYGRRVYVDPSGVKTTYL
jgi:hypothetical protein